MTWRPDRWRAERVLGTADWAVICGDEEVGFEVDRGPDGWMRVHASPESAKMRARVINEREQAFRDGVVAGMIAAAKVCESHAVRHAVGPVPGPYVAACVRSIDPDRVTASALMGVGD